MSAPAAIRRRVEVLETAAAADDAPTARRGPRMNDQAAAEQRRPPPEFWPKLHHKPITVRIAGAPSISGTLEGFSIYEIVIKTAAGKSVMVPKHSILSVDLPEDWRRPGDGAT